MKTILVTGVGAIMGYGLLRSLKYAKVPVRLIGTDIYAEAIGQYWSDFFEQAPLTSDSNYLVWLKSIIEKYNVDLVIPGIEQDVHKFSDEYSALTEYPCKFVINNQTLVHLCKDKWLMHEELSRINSPTRIPSHLFGDYSNLATQIGNPFILKPRKSYASKGLIRIHNEQEFLPHKNRMGEYLMAQPIVGSDDKEFTVGVFGNGAGAICAYICMQRYLAKDGSTSRARTCDPFGLREEIAHLCEHFKPLGPTNFQFRQVDNGWKLLEINPRISSTSSLRTLFGYNEALMCIEYYLDGKLPTQPKLNPGYAIRYIEDYVIYDRDNI